MSSHSFDFTFRGRVIYVIEVAVVGSVGNKGCDGGGGGKKE